MLTQAILIQQHLRILASTRTSLRHCAPSLVCAETWLDNPSQILKLYVVSLLWLIVVPRASSTDRGEEHTVAHVEKVLVYYTGKRTLLLAALKFSTLFLSCFSLVIAAPAVGSQTSWGALGFIGGAQVSPPLMPRSFAYREQLHLRTLFLWFSFSTSGLCPAS